MSGEKDGFADSELEDNEIAECVKVGERELFRFLIDRHKRKVNALGMGFLHNAEDAADFTQEVFLKAFHSLEQFQGKSRFSTWLYRVAYNTAVNKLNRRKEYVSLADNAGIESPVLSPEESSIRQAVCLAVRRAVAGLPERYRICIDLFFFYECSYEEIGVITGEPVNTIKSHIFRAKKILREKLQDVQDFPEKGR